MRFKLLLEVNKQAFGNALPLNYQYEQSAAIYKILGKGNSEYSKWLHDNGYKLENGKRFKLFTFSRFKIENRKILPESERILILSDSIEWQISFLPEKSTEKFIQGIFSNQTFQIGDKKSTVQFRVANIEILSIPDFKEDMVFETMSPICIRHKMEDNRIEYLSPTDSRAKNGILSGLLNRYHVFYDKPYDGALDFDFTVINTPKPVLIKIKADTPEQTKVKGYMCKFKIKAPNELIHIMYDSGIGEEAAQGFGCVRVSEINMEK